MGELTILIGLIEKIGPTASVLIFIIYLLLRDRRDGNGKTTIQSMAATQELMAHTIDLIEENGSVPFQVHVAKNEERMKHVDEDIVTLKKEGGERSDQLDVIDDGCSMSRRLLNSVITNHNRLHPDSVID